MFCSSGRCRRTHHSTMEFKGDADRPGHLEQSLASCPWNSHTGQRCGLGELHQCELRQGKAEAPMSLTFVTVSGKRSANNAVSASALGFVQSGISGRDQYLRRELGWIRRNHANAHRHQSVNSFGVRNLGCSQVLP
jgi:hypothetical protein